jgi:CelD/BcsL family acetyltransferase involved in cellulose biosynthesis
VTLHLLGLPRDLAAISPHTGPFPHAPFLTAAERAFATPDTEAIVIAGDSGAVALSVESDVARFAGDASITDYHSPLGSGAAAALADALAASGASRFELDSMPSETTDLVTSVLDRIGASYIVDVHAATGVLDLPESYEDWLMGIGKKERHEVRRKRRRFEEEFGVITVDEVGAEGVGAFCDLHRASPGDKGTFMTPTMEAFFSELVTSAGASIHNLVCDGRTLASAFGFETAHGYYYYNSAFDGAAAQTSPGVVLLSAIIEHQIERGAQVFDFLKGAESYKYRHGAVPRELFVARGTLP